MSRQARKDEKAERKRLKKESEGTSEDQRAPEGSENHGLPESPGEA